jgi:AraC-like DNA-binding protein
LRDGAHIGEVSARVGYESEAAFNRAFKRNTGTPPASWRRKILAPIASLLALAMPVEDWLANLLVT